MTEEELEGMEVLWLVNGHDSLDDAREDIERLIAEVRRLKDENKTLKNPLITSSVIERLSKEKKELEDLIPTLEVENNMVRARNERLERELDTLNKYHNTYVETAHILLGGTLYFLSRLEEKQPFDESFKQFFNRLKKTYEKMFTL